MKTNASGMSRPRARAAAGPTAGCADASGSTIALELMLGRAFGVLLPPATGTILYATCHLTHTNLYLAAFSLYLAAFSAGAKAAQPLGGTGET
ncbi:hypothetical protein [Streptomyces mirabilis]|jgi:hypothetical protein|uniref:Uncharacterized protein n=1 Tax=Streptomyces mirabilis TaxID=68239 RepID=A0A1I2MEV9_9ACTN|nr:hypothetical protein SAMN02787118_113115 [Streptomyces mirabilis]